MRVLLDTNAWVELRRGNASVAQLVREAESLVFSAVVAGELLYGFQYGTKYLENLRDLQAFLDSPRVDFLDVTLATGEHFGRIAALLRKKGAPIPTNDVWIASHAMEAAAHLISFDQHFRRIDGLAWLRPPGFAHKGPSQNG